jgi:ABC-type Na+ transport system ATPase subunit NatA
MTDKIAIKVEGLTKSYGRVQALRGIDLEVERGEIFGFLGPNGAGKTTTIRCLLDAIRPNSGTIRVLGMDPQADPVAVQRSIGYLPGELQLYDNLTAEGLFHYLNSLRGGKAEWKHVEQLAERLELDIRRRIKNLSSGNKQKVGVIQALMHRPELLLMDEPTRGLDPLIQQEVLGILREAQSDGATVFFSSHILSEVQAAAEPYQSGLESCSRPLQAAGGGRRLSPGARRDDAVARRWIDDDSTGGRRDGRVDQGIGCLPGERFRDGTPLAGRGLPDLLRNRTRGGKLRCSPNSRIPCAACAAR